MLSNLQSKVETIAEKYADLVDNRIQAAIDEKEVDSTALTEINDGIRILNHAASTLERIARLQRGDDANGITIALPPPPQVRREVKRMVEKRNANLTIYVDAATKTLHMFSGNFSVVLSADEAKYTIKLLNRLIQEW